MILKTLSLTNFRQFKGNTKVFFSTDPKHNVTIILGDNTFGKTTLLQAFNWCFYGTTTFSNNPDFLLNLEISEALPERGVAQVVVEIELTHNDALYTIARSEDYTRFGERVSVGNKQNSISFRNKDGNTCNIRSSDTQKIMRDILPEELLGYFFFDTERVCNISDCTDLKDAVKGLLGLTQLENAIKHIGTKGKMHSVIGQLYGQLDAGGDAKAEAAKRRIEQEQNRHESLTQQLETCDEQIAKYESRQDGLEEILRTNPSTKPLQREKESCESYIVRANEKQERYLTQSFQAFDGKAINYFAQPLLLQASKYLQTANIADKGVKDLTKTILLEIIKRGYCLCGQKLEADNDAYRHLQNEMQYVPPESIGTTVRYFKERIASFGARSEHIQKDINDIYDSIIEAQQDIQQWQDRIEEISRQLIGKTDVSQYESELINVKVRLKELRAKHDQFIIDINGSENDMRQSQKVLDSLATSSEKNQIILKQLTYAEELFTWINDAYQKRAAEIRSALEERVNALFQKMYHVQRRVIIDSRYHVTLLANVGGHEIETGESEGLKRVKNFAFIAGLVDLAKPKTQSEDTNQPYPLVMDAPFSNADERHIRNISSVLPETAEQVIMFVMEKDWKYACDTMGRYVGATCKLIKHTDTYTELAR